MAFFPNSIRWKRFFAYILFFITGILTLVGVAYKVVTIPGGPFFNGPPIIAPEIIETFEIFAFFFVMLYQTVTDLVPFFIYYHCGTGLKKIANELNTLLPSKPTNMKTLKKIQSKL